jgi:hypothetical protein
MDGWERIRERTVSEDPTVLPEDLPAPEDDGAASGLVGRRMPTLALSSTSGGTVRIDRAPEGAERLVLYAYPRTGRPGEPPLTPDWNLIPGDTHQTLRKLSENARTPARQDGISPIHPDSIQECGEAGNAVVTPPNKSDCGGCRSFLNSFSTEPRGCPRVAASP